MTGLLMKIIICPLVIILSDLLFANINYANIYQSIGVGLVLAFSAHLMEVMMLRRGTFWASTVADFVAAGLIVYLSGFVLAGATVTLGGAVLTALLLTATEYFQHLYLLRTRKTAKSE